MADAPDIDYAAEGLLDGLEGKAREARLGLLEQLSGEGLTLDELRDAVAAGHLTLLPVERAIAGGGPRYTAREIAALAGADLDLLLAYRAALGIPWGDVDERVANEADLEAARRITAILDAGFPAEEILRNARTIGMATAR
ncbi:MAG TPA: adenylate cyclase regulatory domain-containing protein, partial [Solirubrobacterales bacterium]|nr:adenylate cyclase regulatory domain-containing protein [Solirubrobacterales bacterium]